MPNITVDDNDISILCDIGGTLTEPLDASKLARVIGLIADGYVRREPKGLELTDKAQELLAERGVGINEA
jgi:hypothetical protein